MKQNKQEIENAVLKFGLSSADVARRKAFLEISDTDGTLLTGIHRQLSVRHKVFTDAFYDHLLRFPALQALLEDPATLERLKQAQSAYFHRITGGTYDEEYAENRLRIGAVHQRIGLEPQWYIGAYRKYLSELMPALWELLQDNPEQFLATYDAVLKIVCFDMSLALDTYIHAGKQEILWLKNFAEQVIGSMPIGLMVIDAQHRIRTVNQALRQIFDNEKEVFAPDAALSTLIPCPGLVDRIEHALATGAAESNVVICSGDADNERHLRCALSWIDQESERFLLLVVEDISTQKAAEGKLQRMASQDALTGLPNRALLYDRLAQAIAYAERSHRHIAVLFIDLDRFKIINDSLGHDIGDDVIIETGRRLVSAIRAGDTAARLGGDEFVVVLADVAREDEVAALAQKALDALARPMTLRGQELTASASIGVSLFPRDGRNYRTLLKNADAAMYRAKSSGRNTFQFYEQEMNDRALDRLKIETDLRHALERDELVLHYQPQVDIASGRIVGAEALLRWQPMDRPMVMPADFIPIAEESGLICHLGEWVLRTACAQQVAWLRHGLPAISIAVNLSPRQFRQAGMEACIAHVLQETGCNPTALELEVTESVLMEHPERAAQTLQRLADTGIRLSIDDFGTGYSSLAYLKRFPIHRLKVDRSFMSDVGAEADGADPVIAKSIIALGHSMKLKVICEGVETVEQLDFLRVHGCNFAQGFYFSRPVPADRMQDLLANQENINWTRTS